MQPPVTTNQLPSDLHSADCCVVAATLLLATQVPVAVTTEDASRPVGVAGNATRLATVALHAM